MLKSKPRWVWPNMTYEIRMFGRYPLSVDFVVLMCVWLWGPKGQFMFLQTLRQNWHHVLMISSYYMHNYCHSVQPSNWRRAISHEMGWDHQPWMENCRHHCRYIVQCPLHISNRLGFRKSPCFDYLICVL